MSNVVETTFFSLFILGLCLLILMFNSLCVKRALLVQELQAEEAVELEKSKEERREEKKESISNGLIVKEWLPDDPPIESTEGDRDIQPSGDAVETPQSAPVPPISSSPASCAMGSDDCESLAEEEDMAGCAICLSHFESQQLVCESNNSSCQHIFHKDCMVDWLMKGHDTCPMCREVYLLKTV
jgi:hypothetical protein